VPQFKVKDLMINVASETAQNQVERRLCPAGSFCWPDTNWCPTWISRCDWFSRVGCHTWLSNCDWRTIVACHRFISDCPTNTVLCRYDSGICPDATLICKFSTEICPGNSIICPGGSDPCGLSELNPGDIYTNPEVLGALKEHLRQTLAQVEAQERAAAENLQPQTVEQVDALTKQLTEGLEELKARRQELQKRGAAKQ
jgi:hypothetical protein